MISDGDLYQLAIFLGSVAMMLVVLYHFLEVNARTKDTDDASSAPTSTSSVSGIKKDSITVVGSHATAGNGAVAGAGVLPGGTSATGESVRGK